MATGSGLDGQLGFAAESTWGTEATPDHFVEFNSEELQFSPEWLEPTGIRAGIKYKRENRVRQSRKSVTGSVEMEHATKGMGLLWSHALGSSATPTQPDSTNAPNTWEQIHVPGEHLGKGLTFQVGRPEPSTGTVKPFTYSGCKIVSWEFSLEDNSISTLNLTVDGREESVGTALAAVSYLSGSSVFDFSQATLSLGGTVDTTSGKTTVSGGTAVATVVSQVGITGEAPRNVERFGIGNAGRKSEQLENETPTITGSLSAEFNQAELYDVFQNNETNAFQLTVTGEEIDTGFPFTLEFIIPAVKFKSAAPQVSGAEVVQMETEFEAYADEINPVVQVRIVSDEDTL